MAHEFLHYIEYVRKFERLDIISDEISSTLFEAKYADACRSFKPELIFTHSNKSPQIIKHLREKFQNHSVGERLIKKTKENWINNQVYSLLKKYCILHYGYIGYFQKIIHSIRLHF